MRRRLLSKKCIVLCFFLTFVMSLFSGCKTKTKTLFVLPLDAHPVGSFEPFLSIRDAYDSSQIWNVPFEQLENRSVLSKKNGFFSLGYVRNNQILMVDVDDQGKIEEKNTIDLPIPGIAMECYEAGEQLYSWIVSGEKNFLASIAPDSTASLLQLPDNEYEKRISIQWVGIIDQTVYYVRNNIITEMDITGSVIKEKKMNDTYVDIAINDQFVYFLEEIGEYSGAQKFRLSQISRESFKETSQVEFTGLDYFHGSPELFPDIVNDSVILNMETGILRCRPDAKEFNLLVNLSDYGITDAGVVAVSEKSVIIWSSFDVIGERERFEGLVRCCFSDGQTEKTPIHAALFNVGGEYLPIIAAFNRSQPEYYCAIDDLATVLKDRLSGLETEDDIKRAFLNVLMNKDTVDLFFFPIEDLQFFVDNQVLLDINTLYDDYDDLLHNIIQASDTDKKRYFITPFYSLLFETYDKKVASSNEILFGNVSKQTDVQRIFHSTDNRSMVELERCCAFVRKELSVKGKISEESLRCFFQIMNKQNNNYFEALSLKEELEKKNVLMIDTIISKYSDYVGLSAFYGEQVGVSGPWGYSKPVICADEYIGVNAGSKNTEACKSLLTYILSYEVQYSFAGRVGLPINKDALKGYLDYSVDTSDTANSEAEYLDVLTSYRSDSENKARSEVVERELSKVISEMEQGAGHDERGMTKEPLPKGVVLPSSKDEYFAIAEQMEKLIESAEEYYQLDEEIRNILYEEYLTFRSGEKQEDDVIVSLKSRLELCWAERMT